MKINIITLILLFMPIAFSVNFSNYDIVYDASTSTIKIDASIFLESNTSGLDFSIFTEPEDVEVISSVPIDYRIKTSDGHKIEIDFIQPTSGEVSVSIKFNTVLVETLNDRSIFSIAFDAPLDIDRFSLKLLLPETSQIYYHNNQPLVSPRADIETDGKRIILSWATELNQGDSYIAVAAFTKPQKQVNMSTIILLGIAIITLSIFAVWKFFKRKSHKPIISSMSEDERNVFNIIEKNKGITQEELRDKTGYSKSKISKLIRNLEKMDVIRKTPYKKTNKLESKL